MRIITYTYDEEHPTNRDYLVAALADAIDDGVWERRTDE